VSPRCVDRRQDYPLSPIMTKEGVAATNPDIPLI
jgi:hypothetical protein